MKRNRYITLMVVAGLGLGGALSTAYAVKGSDQLVADANKSISAADATVVEARLAIENAKQLLSTIPADSALMTEVTEVLAEVKSHWALAVEALDGAKESASKIPSASSSGIAEDYKLLATVNAGVALSGAEVVKTGVVFVEAVAANNAEALDGIRAAMQDVLAASTQVEFNYERVKSLITKKYSK